MLTRDYKLCGPGEYYHIYNRGNAKENVFLDDTDYKFFLLRLKQNLGLEKKDSRFFKPLPLGSFSLIAYCLMPNHFHMLIRQNMGIPTSKLLGKQCTSYSMYFNKKYDRVGHVFQDQFKQKNIQNDAYLLWLSAYIHLNPVWANLVNTADNYQWSSVNDYIGKSKHGLVEAGTILEQLEKRDYKDFLIEAYQMSRDKIKSDLEFADFEDLL
ncbi:MAG: transposase [Candidatus Paceibacterota bacterium]